MIPYKSLFIGLAGIVLSGCGLMLHETDEVLLRALTASEQEVVQTDNAFGLNLFRAMIEEESAENILISPLSISMALGMTLNGASGQTYEDMVATLEKAGLAEYEINQTYSYLIDLVTGLDPKVTVALANSIWYRDTFEVEQPFLDTNLQYFDAQIADLDFDAPKSVDIINDWVNQKTNGKIAEIIEEIGPETVMFLVNALYFKGNWTYQFDPAETFEAAFHNADESVTQVPTMHMTATLPYLRTNTFTAVDLPYGDSLFSMMVILPDIDAGISGLVNQLNETSLAQWVIQLTPAAVSLALPRFEIAYEDTLRRFLKQLGMSIAFRPYVADFTRMNRNGMALGLHIEEVYHKTYIEVNEEGTKAAAVTAVQMDTESSAGAHPLRFDRPFVFVIRERHSNALLFIGHVAQM